MNTIANELADVVLLVEGGDLDRAQGLTEDLLVRYPNSGPVHALMGDIAAARRNHREAIDWYELALRLGNDPSVAARLDRQRALQEAAAEAEIDELLAPPRDNRRLLMAAIIGGFVVVALLVWVFAAMVPRRQAGGDRARVAPSTRIQARRAAPEASTTSPTLPTASGAPVTTGGRPATGAQATPARPSGAAQSPSASAQPINITQSVDAPMSNRDRLLTQGLAGITWPNGEALGWRVQGMVDDYTGYAMITVEVAPGLRSADLSNAVIDMAYKLAVATVQADKGVQSLTVRAVTDVDVDGKRMSLLAFRGNTTREHLDYYLKRGLQPDRRTIWEHVFATTWWNPSVPTGVEQEQTQ